MSDYQKIENMENIERIKVKNVWQIKLDDLNSDYIWKHFTENNYYSVGFSDVNLNIDLSKYKSPDEIFEKLEKSRNDNKINEECSTAYTFINEIKIGDIIVVSPAKNIVCGIGIVISDYIPPKKSNIPFYANLIHSRKIRWLYTNVVDLEKGIISNKNIEKIEADNWNKIILKYMDPNTKISFLNKLITSYRDENKYNDDFMNKAMPLFIQDFPSYFKDEIEECNQALYIIENKDAKNEIRKLMKNNNG